MRHEKVTVVLLLAFVISVPAASGRAVAAARGSGITAHPASLPHRVPAFRSTAATAAQDPLAVEAAVGLDRPARRLIQQGLRNEGFDAGAPDGLFGPRTRGAIRRWQEARGMPVTGYLDGTQAQLLRAAAEPQPAVTEERPAVAPPIAESSTAPARMSASCEQWNTQEFFESVRAADVSACLAAGADVAARDDDGLTPLHWAASSSEDAAVIEALLAGGARLGAKTENGATPLRLAARNSASAAVLDALLDARGDVAAEDDVQTLLRLAINNNSNPAIIEALLAAGAHVPDTIGPSFYLNSDSPTVLQALLDAGLDRAENRGETLFLSAAKYTRDPAIIELLLSAGVDPMERSALTGNTALHWAGENSVGGVVDALLLGGADIGARNDDGKTPLHVANSYTGGGVDVVTAMLRAGADPNARDRYGIAPLHESAKWARDVTKIEALLAAGSGLEARTSWGATPLHFAADNGARGPAIETLVAAGASLEARDRNGNTPLHVAASYVHFFFDERFEGDDFAQSQIERMSENEKHAGDAIAALLDAGANPGARNAEGQTPWEIAEQNEVLKGSNAYWRLNGTRFDAPRQESRRPATTPDRQRAATPRPPVRRGPACEIPGYPTPANPQNLGLSWCSSSVDFQRRVFALQAAGAWCAIDIGSSSTLDQIDARHQEINAACDTLDAFAAQGGPSCRCTAGYRP